MVYRSILLRNLLDLLRKFLSMLSFSFDWIVVHILKHSSCIACLNGWHIPHTCKEVLASVISILLLIDKFAYSFWCKNFVTLDLQSSVLFSDSFTLEDI